jgi:tetratricopeptide (TPR) repeat protein
VVRAGFVIFFVGFLGLAWPIGSWIFGFGTSPTHDAARCVQLAGQQLARDDFSGAVASCDQALAVDPNFASAYMLRGNAELLQGLFTAAQADYREAQRLAPISGYPLAGQAFLLALDGDFPRAERVADAALQKNNDAANAWMARLYVHLSRGESQLALEMYRQVLISQEAPARRQAVRDRLAETDELDLLGEMVWLMVGNHYRPLRRGPLALPAAEELADRTGRQSPQALAVLAAAYAVAGRFDDATATQTEVLGLLDSDAEASPAELAECRRVLALYRGGLPYEAPAPAPAPTSAAVPDGDDETDDESAPAR